ncbi:phosphonate metabolism protein/1,5-bisphosphokinase (PRPP-forming) PhnN [Williamsia sterculiae]|uniref:Ribose 1,5-bisphosphate phosphokinase PhnN n=1 Tax=Williamsia sterculiae TaxID=1344003 RepID=A0A1N7FJS1_9NOCA|nr:phosphonate metabolism protein/1,5-bisphosphokinase (PRPP-forming) PhnN [Williamsia sterculiae]SIS00573.1 ribose 1,5-bisphosphokinase [Williamsia sterculiae]
MTDRIGPGYFVAVTGASGVGKDALLDAARWRCPSAVVFPQRTITRPTGPGEDYRSVDEAEFVTARARGEFAVSWQAHGLHYGIPASIDQPVRAGGVVVANVSRGAIDDLRDRYENVVEVRITVSEETRERRLRERRRESADDVAGRLARTDPGLGRQVDHQIHNDGVVEAGAAQLVDIVTRRVRAAEVGSPRSAEDVT